MSTASVDVTCHGRVRHRERVERRSQSVPERVNRLFRPAPLMKNFSPIAIKRTTYCNDAILVPAKLGTTFRRPFGDQTTPVLQRSTRYLARKYPGVRPYDRAPTDRRTATIRQWSIVAARFTPRLTM